MTYDIYPSELNEDGHLDNLSRHAKSLWEFRRLFRKEGAIRQLAGAQPMPDAENS